MRGRGPSVLGFKAVAKHSPVRTRDEARVHGMTSSGPLSSEAITA